MTHTFDSKVSSHSWLLWPTVRHAGDLASTITVLLAAISHNFKPSDISGQNHRGMNTRGKF